MIQYNKIISSGNNLFQSSNTHRNSLRSYIDKVYRTGILFDGIM